MYTAGGGGRGAKDFFGGVLKVFDGKRGGMVKFLKAGRGDANFFRCHRKIKLKYL